MAANFLVWIVLEGVGLDVNFGGFFAMQRTKDLEKNAEASIEQTHNHRQYAENRAKTAIETAKSECKKCYKSSQ